eukprot:GILI01008637.1.p1 GENE.GILI01008637.1~~GILI01008637.1.p1  ORF type:complete len:695 (+),score=230.16 GILI01008637.1:67-2151(+)
MATVEQTAKASVDLADLFSVTVNSKQLEIVLSSLLSRVGDLEKNAGGDRDQAASDNNALVGAHPNSQDKLQPDWSEAIEKLRRDIDAEKQRGDAQQQLIEDLQKQNEKLSSDLQQAQEGIQGLNAKVADLDDQKADKAAHVDPLAEEIAKLKKDLANNSNTINAVAARAATLEGLSAAADPQGAKEKGLTSFTDTLNDVLNKQKELEEALSQKGDTDKAAEKEVAELKKRLEDQEEKQKEAEGAREEAAKTMSEYATLRDLDALAKDLGTPSGAAAPAPRSSIPNGDNSLLDALRNDVDALKNEVSKLSPSSTVINNTNTTNSPISNNAADLEGRVAALEKDSAATRKDLADHKASTEKAIEDLTNDLTDTKDSLQNAVKEIKALGQECSKNTADCKLLHDRKADKTDLLAAQSPVDGAAAGGNNVNLSGIQKFLDALDGRVSGLAQDKAGKDAVNQLMKDLAELKNVIKGLQNNIANNGNAAGDRGAAGSPTGAGINADQLEKDNKDLQRRLEELDNWAKGQLIEIRATVDHIHHCKADASIVANKAERDYVENAMEKLMHEVETVLNATNAGLIDTLDKSLNILRDMIDGKATKQDVNKLQGLVNANSAGDATGVPDGLAGYKTYRCLGCNRTMDTMRPRPMGSTMNSFTSRVPPASGRNAPSSSQGPRPTYPLPIQPSQPSVAAIAPPPPK